MKRLFVFTFVLVTVFIFVLSLPFTVTACRAGRRSYRFLSVQNSNGDMIYYGMPLNVAERILGRPIRILTNKYDFGGFRVYRGGVTIMLNADGHIFHVSIRDGGWRTTDNVEVGVTTLCELRTQYAPYLRNHRDSDSVFELFLDNNRRLLHHGNGGYEYIIAFRINPDNNIVSFISFGSRE